MVAATATAMDALDIAEFLAARHTGVLALASEGNVYAVPVSYAYDEDRSDLYFRLAYGPNSQKRSYVETADKATFVVYDDRDGRWQSVVAEGRPEPVSESNLDTAVGETVSRLRIPFFQLHRRPADELEFTVVHLDVDKLTGISERLYAR